MADEIHRCDTCTDCIPRASRAPDGHVPLDPDFLAALTKVPEEAVREKELHVRARKCGAI